MFAGEGVKCLCFFFLSNSFHQYNKQNNKLEKRKAQADGSRGMTVPKNAKRRQARKL
jgi:hypothetical protein